MFPIFAQRVEAIILKEIGDYVEAAIPVVTAKASPSTPARS
jgi:hypothetical protein